MKTELLVPGMATATEATLWAGVVSLNGPPQEPTGANVSGPGGTTRPIENWTAWTAPDGSAGVATARVSIDGLSPGTRQPVTLRIGDRVAATATITTLPDRLAGVGDRPFTLLLASCFCAAEDKGGRAGRTFNQVPAGLKPDLKIFCGDQVYLDSPFYRFLFHHSEDSLASTFLSNYANTWGQSGDLAGYQLLLAGGANLFTSDDHEFWNNAPYPSFSMNTWTRGGRDAWLKLAKGLYAAFQTPADDVRRFKVGELSLFIADTRIHRSDDRTTFLNEPDMQELEEWAAGLTFPGVLVVGQPLFHGTAGALKGRFGDWNLPDFEQYERLCRAIMTAPQSIVVLTGDVHYGRVARVRLPNANEIVEIISSPTSLVTGGGKRVWEAPPSLFPANPLGNLPRAGVTPVNTWQRANDHFITIEFWQDGGRLRLRVRTWETAGQSGPSSGIVFEDFVQRSA